jgi:hypothetical protein
MATSGSADFVLLTRLADEFAERYRRGERPSLTEYVERYPHLAAEICEVFPALVKGALRVPRDGRSARAPAPVASRVR